MKFSKLVLILVIMALGFTTKSSFAQSQTALNMKAYDDYKKSDKELNGIYQQILKQYAKQTQFIKNIKNAQRLWVQLRDADLAAKYPEPGTYGSVAPMCESIYLEDLTRERIKHLKVWITGIEEGEVCLGSVKTKN